MGKKNAVNELTIDRAWDILTEIKDPEIPVVSLVEMGMIRSVEVSAQGELVRVTMTPTYSGCPAIQMMQAEIDRRLKEAGANTVQIAVSHNPPWTSDWITPVGREKLEKFGVAPAPVHHGSVDLLMPELVTCPYCHSHNTVLKNRFGPTLCRSIYYCNECQQPFEQFKPI